MMGFLVDDTWHF